MTSVTDTTYTNGQLDHESVLDDAHLLAAFQRGNIQAFERIYAAHSAALFAYGKRLCADRQLVADTIQDVFVDIWTQRSTLENIQALRYYMFRILRNKLARAYKNEANFLPDDNLATHQTLTELSAEQFIIQQETQMHQQRNVQQAVVQLPDRQREAVVLAFYHDFTNNQIAGIMGISHQSVINHLNRAFTSLRGAITIVKMAGLLLTFCV